MSCWWAVLTSCACGFHNVVALEPPAQEGRTAHLGDWAPPGGFIQCQELPIGTETGCRAPTAPVHLLGAHSLPVWLGGAARVKNAKATGQLPLCSHQLPPPFLSLSSWIQATSSAFSITDGHPQPSICMHKDEGANHTSAAVVVAEVRANHRPTTHATLSCLILQPCRLRAVFQVHRITPYIVQGTQVKKNTKRRVADALDVAALCRCRRPQRPTQPQNQELQC